MSKFTDLDRRIITLLQQDGRMSNSEIGRRVGVTEATVRRRIDRLLLEKFIHIAAVANPFKIGLNTVALISVDADLSRLQEVARALVAMKEVRYVGYATGAHDIIIEAIFPDNTALLRFVSDRLAKIPGIRRTETSIQLDILKRSYEWEIPPTSDQRRTQGEVALGGQAGDGPRRAARSISRNAGQVDTGPTVHVRGEEA